MFFIDHFRWNLFQNNILISDLAFGLLKSKIKVVPTTSNDVDILHKIIFIVEKHLVALIENTNIV